MVIIIVIAMAIG